MKKKGNTMFNVKIADIKLQKDSTIDNLIQTFQNNKDTLDIYVDFHNEVYYEYFVKTIILKYLKEVSPLIFQQYLTTEILIQFLEEYPEYKCIFEKKMNEMDKEEKIKEFKEKFFPKIN